MLNTAIGDPIDDPPQPDSHNPTTRIAFVHQGLLNMSDLEKPVRQHQSSSRLKAVGSLTNMSTASRGLFAASLPDDIDSEAYPSTPPAQLLSPQPRTPRPTRFLSPPRTPLPKLFTDFLTAGDRLAEADSDAAEEVEGITRPGSACSNYSSSSDSSFDSLTTFTTTGGSCTSPEIESSFFPDEPATKEVNDTTLRKANSRGEEGNGAKTKGKPNIRSRVHKVHWTEDMDGHLWRAYLMCQQDPKITPFYVLPGQVPPLGVCHKVAREAKQSWKAKMGDGWRIPLKTAKPRQRRFVTPAKELGVGNRGDALRKTSPYSWPASEASTRRRLRELCRQSYGPSRNPHHGYHKQRRPTAAARDVPSRSSTVSPSPYQPTASDRVNSRDAFLFSTRSIALSLTTSTATTMNPNGVLAAIAAGYDIDAGMTFGSGSFDANIGGRISGVNNNHRAPGIGFLNDGSRLGPRFSTQQDSIPREGISGFLNAIPLIPNRDILGGTPPALLPPLELNSSSSAFGTWPRRQKRQEELESGDESITLPPPRRARRGTLGDLFVEPVPIPIVPRTRARGFTIGSTSTSGISRRRYRPLAPLLTVTGPVSYDSPNNGEGLSPLAAREPMSDPFRDSPETLGRLGSPFVERKDRKGKKFEGSDEYSSEIGDEEFLGRGDFVGVIASMRPAKRARE